jgi:cytochrome c-type biogenesis protein CcsB
MTFLPPPARGRGGKLQYIVAVNPHRISRFSAENPQLTLLYRRQIFKQGEHGAAAFAPGGSNCAGLLVMLDFREPVRGLERINMGLTLQVALVLYTLGLLHSLFGFFTKRQVFVQVALGMVALGFASQTAFMILTGIERRHFPITSLPETLCFFSWCVILIFIIASLTYKVNVLGAFVLPLVSLLTIITEIIWEEHHTIPPELKSIWVACHSTVAMLAYAAFFLTFVSGVMYLIQEKELKSKNFRFMYFRLPSLQVCDDLMLRSLYAGFILMSITILTGAYWAQSAWGRFWSWDPKETASLVSWLIYLLLIIYRLSAGWRGRVAAYISIAGFISIILTFGLNWAKGLHTYL